MKHVIKELIKNEGGKMNNFSRKIQNNYPEIYDYILQQPGYKFNEKCYLIFHNMPDIPRCIITKNELNFINFFKGYRPFDRSVKNKDIEEYIKNNETFLNLNDDDYEKLKYLKEN